MQFHVSERQRKNEGFEFNRINVIRETVWKEGSFNGNQLNNRERKDHRAFRTQWFWKDNIDQVIKRSVAANIR